LGRGRGLRIGDSFSFEGHRDTISFELMGDATERPLGIGDKVSVT